MCEDGAALSGALPSTSVTVGADTAFFPLQLCRRFRVLLAELPHLLPEEVHGVVEQFGEFVVQGVAQLCAEFSPAFFRVGKGLVQAFLKAR